MASPSALAKQHAQALADLRARQDRIEQKLDAILAALEPPAKRTTKKEQAHAETQVS